MTQTRARARRVGRVPVQRGGRTVRAGSRTHERVDGLVRSGPAARQRAGGYVRGGLGARKSARSRVGADRQAQKTGASEGSGGFKPRKIAGGSHEFDSLARWRARALLGRVFQALQTRSMVLPRVWASLPSCSRRVFCDPICRWSHPGSVRVVASIGWPLEP